MPNGGNHLSAEIKSLIKGLVSRTPADRPNLEEILSHPWMHGPVANNDDIKMAVKTGNLGL